jgi:hypothetical protein
MEYPRTKKPGTWDTKMIIVARIITGKSEWIREVPHEKKRPIWKICAETQKQLESEQWLKSKGFIRIA